MCGSDARTISSDSIVISLPHGNSKVSFDYSCVSNKRACAFILFETFIQLCTALFEPARLLIVEEAILPAPLLKPASFWILILAFSEKCSNCCQIVAATQVQQPRTNFD